MYASSSGKPSAGPTASSRARYTPATVSAATTAIAYGQRCLTYPRYHRGAVRGNLYTVRMGFERELTVAEDLARRAGRLILGYFGTGLSVEKKTGDEPVTRADREASELIVAGLRAGFPDDIVVSEEAPDDPQRLGGGRRVWFVDPLDGTRDFIRGRHGFAVMIGLCDGARPT